jgi:predicted MFS family arabinose efflux permease
MVGFSLGFSLQFRFAAAESVSLERVSHAVSFILLGSIAGAFMGPALVAWSAAADADSPYGLAFELLVVLYAIGGVLLLLLRSPDVATEEGGAEEEARPVGEVVRQPLFITAVLAGLVGQGVMTYVMTATPISMSIENGFSVQTTSEVIRAHVIAMYLPSLVTPILISRLGLSRMMVLGALSMLVTIAIGLGGHDLMHYWFALVLLGIGWNFLFVAGTSQLVQTYKPSERFSAQAVNDFSVFAPSAAASLLAGTVLLNLGWVAVMLSSVPALMLVLLAVAWQQRRHVSASA